MFSYPTFYTVLNPHTLGPKGVASGSARSGFTVGGDDGFAVRSRIPMTPGVCGSIVMCVCLYDSIRCID